MFNEFVAALDSRVHAWRSRAPNASAQNAKPPPARGALRASHVTKRGWDSYDEAVDRGVCSLR